MIDTLLVFVEGRLAGLARRASLPNSHFVEFEYESDYISAGSSTPLSIRMPVVPNEYEIRSWLEGLLPDNRDTLKEWAQREGALGIDPLSMLATPIGLDCAGAVQFCQPGEQDVIYDCGSDIEWHSDAEIGSWVRDAKAGQRRRLGRQTRYSLGGWQTKVALYRDGDRWGAPSGRQPTTWILKPGIDPRQDATWPDSDLIEHVTMAAAARIGLDAARTSVERFNGERVLAVERYDRYFENGRWLRTHQEDLCQALGVPPLIKYQYQGGPSPEGILLLLRHESRDRDVDAHKFVDSLIFNWAIGAGDGHAKNYSLLLAGEVVRLAPLYDVMSDLPYRHGSVSGVANAMMVGGGYPLRTADHCGVWEQAGARYGLDPQLTASRAEYILDSCPGAVDAIIDELDPEDRRSPQVAALSRDMRQRRNDVLGKFRRPSVSAPAAPTAEARATPFSAPTATPAGQRQSTPTASGSVICGWPLGPNKSCSRKLLSGPCPDHSSSSGSKRIISRQKRR